MYTIDFNEKENRLLQALAKQGKKLEAKEAPTEMEYRAYNILSNAVARMMEEKVKDIPWESPLVTARGGYAR